VADPGRPIDRAMFEERPDKGYVRNMWAGVVEQANGTWAGPEGLYLTLAGARGYDIRLLIERGLVRTTESGAIHPEDVAKIVAVERGRDAYRELRERFPGLRTIQSPIENLARGSEDLTRFPERRDREAIRSRVINLDYNGSLTVQVREGSIVFPQLSFIQKVSQLHAYPQPALDWTLLLTLNGGIEWPDDAHDPIKDFLLENIKLSAEFSSECQRCLDLDVYNKIAADASVDFRHLPPTQQQTVTSVLVPKKIASLVVNAGWRTDVFANWRYGGVGSAAGMCTWGIRFNWDGRSSYQPNQVYRESLVTMFVSFATISDSGELVDN
jgi:hypothetical protein